MDDLIDVIEGNRKYMKCIYVYNKIDVVGIDDVDRLSRQPNSIVISCNLKVSPTFLLTKISQEVYRIDYQSYYATCPATQRKYIHHCIITLDICRK